MSIADIATTRAVSPVVVRIGDTQPAPFVEFLDSNGTVITDIAGETCYFFLYDAFGNANAEAGVWQNTGFYAPLTGSNLDRDDKSVYRYEIEVTLANSDDSVVRSFPGPELVIYHPQALWTDPQRVMSEAGCTLAEAVYAISHSMESVRAWASRSVGTPVPAVVRSAVATLAARALASSATSGGSAPIVSERIGDYTVRYAEGDASGGAYAITGDLANQLRHLRPTAYGSDIGPRPQGSHEDHPYPITGAAWVPQDLTAELKAYINAQIAKGGGGGKGGEGDQIIMDDDPLTFTDPTGGVLPGSRTPPADILNKMSAAPPGSIFVDTDPATNTMYVWRKT